MCEKIKSVLLVGDSIRIGYCGIVKENLSDIATVSYSDDNARFTKYTLFSIREWIDALAPRADAVVLNCGLWDVVHMRDAEYTITDLSEYGKDIEKIVHQVREALPSAKIIWALITPVDEAGNRKSRPDHPRYNKDIDAFNACATEVVQNLGVDILDLNSVIKNASEPLWSDGVHYIPEGYELLGEAVSHKLRSVL